MKTTYYNENCRHGQNIEISISSGEGSSAIHVTATERMGERTTTATLDYKTEDGSRITEVRDFSAPFDSAFYSALDAKMLKIASAISNDEEEQA